MAEQSIYINETEVMTISDNNYTNTIIQSITGPQGIAGPEGPSGPPGPRGPRGRAAPFYPRTIFASAEHSLNSGINILPEFNASWIKVSSSALSSIHGIATGTEGELRVLTNIGSANIILQNNSTSVLNNQKIINPSNINVIISPNASVTMLYDNSSQKWRTVSSGLSEIEGGDATGS